MSDALDRRQPVRFLHTTRRAVDASVTWLSGPAPLIIAAAATLALLLLRA